MFHFQPTYLRRYNSIFFFKCFCLVSKHAQTREILVSGGNAQIFLVLPSAHLYPIKSGDLEVNQNWRLKLEGVSLTSG